MTDGFMTKIDSASRAKEKEIMDIK
jgi:ribosome recycling factor